MNTIFLDNQSTTPLDPLVLDEMMPWFQNKFGNSSSQHHQLGWEAKEAIDISREKISNLLSCSSREIIFTSGATESNNLAIKGIINPKHKNKHIISLSTEHKSILDPLNYLKKQDYDITLISVNKSGLIDLNKLEESVRDDTILISIMHANNETGVIQPIKEIGYICNKYDILFHTDAVQSIGKIELNLKENNIDLLSISAHKIYGPKGVGALYIKKTNPKIKLQSQIEGGNQELGLRSGTLPTPLIVGFGKACEISKNNMSIDNKRILQLRNMLLEGLMKNIDDIQINGDIKHRIQGNINLYFPNINSISLMLKMPEIAISNGSACSSNNIENSHVLLGMGYSNKRISSSLRFGVGKFNTVKDIEKAIDIVVETVARLRYGKTLNSHSFIN